jgi:hypothetical protein
MKPFYTEINALPEQLSIDLMTLCQEERYLEAINSINQHLATSTTPDGNLLLTLAHLQLEAASLDLEGFNDGVEQALATCRTALRLNAPAARVTALRRRVARLQREEEELAQLLESPWHLDSAGVQQLKKRAYALSDRRDRRARLVAGRLWLIAALRLNGRDGPDPPGEAAFYSYVRAGLDLAAAERYDLAIPILQSVVTPGFAPPYREPWMVDFAYTALVEHAAACNNRTEFERLWWLAVAESLQGYGHFPVAYPAQDRLLLASERLGATKIKEYLGEVFRHYRTVRRLTPELKALVVSA